MHYILTIPELLETIFVCLDKASNAQNLLVCRQWAAISRSVLWRDINTRVDFHNLVQLLGPIESLVDEEGDVSKYAISWRTDK